MSLMCICTDILFFSYVMVITRVNDVTSSSAIMDKNIIILYMYILCYRHTLHPYSERTIFIERREKKDKIIGCNYCLLKLAYKFSFLW